jgi:uncharacterized protein YueI
MHMRKSAKKWMHMVRIINDQSRKKRLCFILVFDRAVNQSQKNSYSKTEVAIFEFNSFSKQAVQLPIALQDSGP